MLIVLTIPNDSLSLVYVFMEQKGARLAIQMTEEGCHAWAEWTDVEFEDTFTQGYAPVSTELLHKMSPLFWSRDVDMLNQTMAGQCAMRMFAEEMEELNEEVPC